MLALSAFKDPLTGEPLQIPAQDRAALNDPKLEADTPEKAYRSWRAPRRQQHPARTAAERAAVAAQKE